MKAKVYGDILHIDFEDANIGVFKEVNQGIAIELSKDEGTQLAAVILHALKEKP